MSNPVDEYLDSCGKQKEASGLASFGREVGRGAADAFSARGLGSLGMQTALIAGAGALAGAARKAYMAATKNTHQRQMLEVNPDLVEHQQRDPKMFNQHYNSLRNLNPAFAADPVVAGSYMRRMGEFPATAGGVLVEAVGHAPRPIARGPKDYATSLDVARSVGMQHQTELAHLLRMQQDADAQG